MIQLYDDRQGVGCQDVLGLLDEGGAAPVPSLPRYTATTAGRGIILKVIVQDHNQLESVYGEHNATTIINNMDTQIFLRQNGIDTSEYVQKRIGLKSGFAHSTNLHDHVEVGEGHIEQAVPLLTVQDITELSDTESIIIHRNLKPIRAERMDFRRYPRLLSATHMPPPTLSELPDIPEMPALLEENPLPARFGPAE
jgi:type IV secretory pathway TraG/TraD family ATPase VirD4